MNRGQCNKQIVKSPAEIKYSKSGKCFCSVSCGTTYSNLHKRHGTTVSKFEKYIQAELPNIFPNLHFIFNNKELINSELDIYIPELKLAFELNGIFHYEPIHGIDKLARIQNNDHRKFQACLENNIELCIIDMQAHKRFNEKTSKVYIDIVSNIINNKSAPGVS